MTITQGDDVIIEATIYSDTAETTVLDLTGFGVPVYRVGSLAENATTLKVNGVISDAANGKVRITLTAAQTAGLADGKHDHQLMVVDGSNGKKTVSHGELEVLERLQDDV